MDREVNAPLERSVNPGEAVILDPAKWTIEWFCTLRKRKKADGYEEFHRKFTSQYFVKCQNLETAWLFSQPWCRHQSTKYCLQLKSEQYLKLEVLVPLSKAEMCGVPNGIKRFFADFCNWDGETELTITSPDLRPDPVTLDPACLQTDLDKIAYKLCLPDAYVIDAYTLASGDVIENCALSEEPLTCTRGFLRCLFTVRLPREG